MDPILLIIKYLFKKKNIINNDETIDSFFKNGVSFPQFIQLIFDVDSIPGIKKNPKLVFQQKINNDTALQYLFFKNAKIKAINPSYETEKNQINLLQLILTLQCFPSNIDPIIEQSNKLLEKSGIHISKKSDLISLTVLSTLLNSFTKGSFPISNKYNEVVSNFTKFDIPLVFNEKSLDVQDSYIFIIQIQIIFEYFSKNANQELKLDQPSISNEQKNQKEELKEQKEQNDAKELKEQQQPKELKEQQQPKELKEQQQPKELKEQQQKNISDNTNKIIVPTTNKPLQKPPPQENKIQQSSNEIPAPSKVPDVKTMSLRERIAFYNNAAQNNEPKKPEVQVTKSEKLQQPPSPKINIQQEEQFLESRDDQEQRQQQTNNADELSNDRKLEKENPCQYSDDEIKKENEIEKEFLDDTEELEPESEDVSEEISEDEEQIEKQYEQFQNFMSDFSDDNNEEDIKKSKDEEEDDDDEISEEEHIGSFVGLSKNLSKISIVKMIGNLKNYTKIDTVLQRLQVDQSTSPDKLWNIQIDSFNYLNGVIYPIDESDYKKTIEKSNSNQDLNTNNGINTRSNLYKFMNYNEQSHCWHFNESTLQNMIKDNRNNPTIPLFLFIDSRMEDIQSFSSVIRRDKLEYNLSDEEEISVYAFWKDSLNFMEYNREKRFETKLTEQLFLYVYVPKNKENHKNIGAILFQIYTFLYLICDLSIVIFDRQYQKAQAWQIRFIKEVIKLSRLITKQTNDFYDKSSLLFLQNSTQTIFLEKDSSPEELHEQLDKIIEQKIEADYELKILQNVKEFSLIIDELRFYKCYKYKTLIETLNHVNSLISQLSSLYLYMRKEKNIYNLIKEVLNKQYKNKNSEEELKRIIENSYNYFPKSDVYVNKVFNMVTLDMLIELNQYDSTNIKKKLKEQSEINLNYLKKKINEKFYWDINQLIIINQSHMNFLEKQFFEIIKSSDNSNVLDVLYEKNLNVLENQKKEDDLELQKIFATFITNIHKKNTIVGEKFGNSAKKGTNYVMKEVQTLREIEVVCSRGGDIDTIIEPDF